jgi:hypothetical protein
MAQPYIKTHGSAFNFVPVGCGEVPKLVLGGNNNFQGTFLPTLFFGQKHPRLIYPRYRYSTITGFCPQNGLCTAHSAGQGSGVRSTRMKHAVMQAQRRYKHCTGTGTV